MARTYPKGSRAKVVAPQGTTVTVTAPDGLQLLIPAPKGSIRFELSQVGVWVYTTEGGASGSFLVVNRQEPQGDPDPVGVVEPG